MTFELDKGRVFTNISLDQKNPGQGYTKDNIQLVCSAVNQLKSNWIWILYYIFVNKSFTTMNNTKLISKTFINVKKWKHKDGRIINYYNYIK